MQGSKYIINTGNTDYHNMHNHICIKHISVKLNINFHLLLNSIPSHNRTCIINHCSKLCNMQTTQSTFYYIISKDYNRKIW